MSKKKVKHINYFPNVWLPDWKEPKEISKEPNSEFVRFYGRFVKLLQDGMYIGGGQVFVHGWMLWHMICWRIELDTLLPNGKSFKTEGVPWLRDNEWDFMEVLTRAEKESKGWEWIGARGFGKSVMLSSVTSYFYTLYHDIEVLLSAGESGDIAKLAEKCEYGLARLDPYTLKKKRVASDWRPMKEVRAGYKDVEGGIHGSNSRFVIRNYDDGNNTMAANGTRPKIHVMDEIGKMNRFIKCYSDSVMCWMNTYGQFGIPICAGTGGDMERGADAAKAFFDPSPLNLLEFPDEWEGKKKPIGFFTPVTKARNEYKEIWTLYRFLTEKKGMKLDPHPDLERITILVSDEERCMKEFVEPRRTMAALSEDASILTSEVAYNPVKPSEAFTVISNNKFPTEAMKRWKETLKDEGITGVSVTLGRMPDGSVFHTFSDDKPIIDYPVKATTNKKGTVMVYEFPEENAPFGLYISGADPYNQNKSTTSPSLGTIYIYKRIKSVTGTFMRQMVASYAARPETMTEWHENVEMLMDWYSAVCMPENEGTTFTQFFDGKFKSHMLADAFDLNKSISPNTKVDRSKGLPATTPVINFSMNLFYDYVNEKLILGFKKNEQTGEDEPVIRMGYTRILDPMLLQECIEYDGEKNADRIVAFRHVLAYEQSLQKFGGNEKREEEQEEEPVTEFRSPFYKREKSTSSLPSRRSPFYAKNRN